MMSSLSEVVKCVSSFRSRYFLVKDPDHRSSARSDRDIFVVTEFQNRVWRGNQLLTECHRDYPHGDAEACGDAGWDLSHLP
jgi:hypothetical protein